MNQHSYPTGSRRALGSWRRVTFAVVAVIAAIGLAACGGSGSGNSSAGAKKHLTIALIPGLTTDPFYITMHNGAAAEAKKLGVSLTWQGGTSFSPSSQIPVVSSLLAKHPSALLIAPTDVTALKGPIQQYVSAHIPVISVDTTLKDTSILDSRITSDNYQGGEAAADILAKLTHDKGAVAVINVNPGVSTTDARQAGFVHEIQTKYPHMQIVAKEYDNDSETTAASQASSIMLAHRNLVGIFGTNLYSAEGPGKAVQAAHKGGKVFVIGYDAEPAEVSLLKHGVIDALVIQRPAEEGMLAVQYAYDILTGKKSKIRSFVQLPNVVATTQNASNPNVSKYFYNTSLSG